uniref:Uncharacterized protein n=1 Tax=Ectopseudomonas oleovorans TaxID=301 RepID=A0A653B0B0_ECTOL
MHRWQTLKYSSVSGLMVRSLFLRCLARLAVVSPNTWEKCSERLSLKVVLLSLSVICGLLRLCGATTLSREPERKSP